MQFNAFLIAAICATAMAQDNSLASELASMSAGLGSISVSPATGLSVLSVLATAIPSSLMTAITDPAVQSSLASDLEAGNTPSWYSALPSDVKSYIQSVGSATGNIPLSSVDSSITAAASSIRASASSQVSAASESAAAATSTSTGGAPAPTAAIVASMGGVVGVLALAIGL